MDVRYAVPRLHRQGKVFDLVFADPPYEMGYVPSTFDLLTQNLVCAAGSVLVIEHSKREGLDSCFADPYEVTSPEVWRYRPEYRHLRGKGRVA